MLETGDQVNCGTQVVATVHESGVTLEGMHRLVGRVVGGSSRLGSLPRMILEFGVGNNGVPCALVIVVSVATWEVAGRAAGTSWARGEASLAGYLAHTKMARAGLHILGLTLLPALTAIVSVVAHIRHAAGLTIALGPPNAAPTNTSHTTRGMKPTGGGVAEGLTPWSKVTLRALALPRRRVAPSVTGATGAVASWATI